MPQTKPMIKGAQPPTTPALFQTNSGDRVPSGRTGELFEPSSGGSP